MGISLPEGLCRRDGCVYATEYDPEVGNGGPFDASECGIG